MTRGDPKYRFVDLRACLLMLAVGLATGCSSTPPLPVLADHAGPRKLYTLLTPGGARFKKEYHTDRLPLGTIKVSDEIWEIGDEAGAVGVADLPVVLGRYQTRDRFGRVHVQQGGAVSDDEMLAVISEYQFKAIHATQGASKAVNRLGTRGKEVEYTIDSRKVRGKAVYLWGSRSLYFCFYAAAEKGFDPARADLIISSFRFSSLR